MLFLWLVLAAAPTSPRSTPDPAVEKAVVRTVVRGFCDADRDGVRLGSDTWPRIQAFDRVDDESGWDTVELVDSYEIGPVSVSGNTASVDVTYHLLGSCAIDACPTKVRDATYRFPLRRADDGWKIDGGVTFAPRISLETARRHFEAIRSRETVGSKEATRMDRLLGDLRAIARAHPGSRSSDGGISK